MLRLIISMTSASVKVPESVKMPESRDAGAPVDSRGGGLFEDWTALHVRDPDSQQWLAVSLQLACVTTGS